jgi:hypothetical protein
MNPVAPVTKSDRDLNRGIRYTTVRLTGARRASEMNIERHNFQRSGRLP